MIQMRFSGSRVCSCKQRQIILALCWSFGLLFGFLLSHTQTELDVSWMHGFLYSTVSIVSLLRVVLLPFLLSAFAVLLSAPALILPVSFCKAFLHGYAVYSLSRTFGVVGWVVSGVFLFSNWASVPVCYWYWHRALTQPPARMWCRFSLTLLLLLGIAFADHFIISSFRAGLIDYLERVNG